MKKLYFLALVLFPLLFISFSSHSGMITPGKKIFVAPMENSLDQFITAEIIKQKLAVTITTDEKTADYILAGTSVNKGNNAKWYDVAFGTAGTRDSVQGSVKLIQVSDKSVVWANNQGDRSFWWGSLKRGGERKVALRLVKAMKKELFSK